MLDAKTAGHGNVACDIAFAHLWYSSNLLSQKCALQQARARGPASLREVPRPAWAGQKPEPPQVLSVQLIGCPGFVMVMNHSMFLPVGIMPHF